MSYTPATKLPTLRFFQWSTPSAPNPTISSPLTAIVTTITVSNAPLDRNGAVITGNFLIGIKRADGYVEHVYVPAGGVSVDGLTFTGCVRGIRLEGLDFTTAGTGLAVTHLQGERVYCDVDAVYEAILQATMQGTVATGGSNFIIGTDAAGDVTISHSTGVGTSEPWIRYNNATQEVQFSDDGSSWTSIVDATASVIFKNSVADTTAGYLTQKLVASTHLTLTTLNPAANEQTQISTDAIQATAGVADANKIIATDGAGLIDNTFINSVIVSIGAPDASKFVETDAAGQIDDSLLTTTIQNTINSLYTGFAYESITAGNAIAERPISIEHYTQLTEVDSSLGNDNPHRKYAMKIIAGEDVNDVTTVSFRAREQVAGATALGNLVVTLETDNAGAPSGTAITNGTITITQVTQRTWGGTYATRNGTWGGTGVDFVKGTTYWLVFACSATDAVNYLHFGDASTYDENYLTFTRLTYDLDTATWGSSTTVIPLFFWFSGRGAGYGMCKTDADWGGRTWTFKGFATESKSQGEDILYAADVTTNQTSLINNREYWLSGTPGALTATQPDSRIGQDYGYKVGRALSATTLKIQTSDKVMVGSGTAGNYITWFKISGLDVIGSTAVEDVTGGFGLGSLSSSYYGTSTAGGGTGSISGNTSSGQVALGIAAAPDATIAISSVTEGGFTLTQAGGAATFGLAFKTHG